MKRRKWLLLLGAWVLLGLGCNRGPWASGDRVLVSKSMYDTNLSRPERYDVVVFKFPVRPIEKGVPKNYIKRLLGLPGQVLAILFGRLFFLDPSQEDADRFVPHVLKTKDGKVFKGFVETKDEAKGVAFRVFQYEMLKKETGPLGEGRDQWYKVSPRNRYSEVKTFAQADIQSLEPIDVAERWKHRLDFKKLDSPWDDDRLPSFPPPPQPTPDETDWQNDFDHLLEDHPRMLQWFSEGKFQIARKSPGVMLAMRRLVFDNDYQPKDLTKPEWQRWAPRPGAGWKSDGATGFQSEAGKIDGVQWLTYQHKVVKGGKGRHLGIPDELKPQLITDLYGYNSVEPAMSRGLHPNWVGDLMLECTLEVSEPKGEFYLELSRGIDRFRARFDLSTGQCTLLRVTDIAGKEQVEELASQPTSVNAKGSYQLRFANFSARLTLWVDRDLPFGNGHDYQPPDVPKAGEFKGVPEDGKMEEKMLDVLAARRGPTDNDLERPASLGVKDAAVEVKQLRLWRDTYYSRWDDQVPYSNINVTGSDWESYRRHQPKFYYIQPGHYMCLGDNSTMSSDSRDWGLVPDRLLLGRAHAVYFPFGRAGPIK